VDDSLVSQRDFLIRAGQYGVALEASRRRAGCSQERCARLLGIDPGTLSR
jgi:hypothetical protein